MLFVGSGVAVLVVVMAEFEAASIGKVPGAIALVPLSGGIAVPVAAVVFTVALAVNRVGDTVATIIGATLTAPTKLTCLGANGSTSAPLPILPVPTKRRL